MVYFDQRGSGRSERPANRDYAMTTLVDDVEALRRQLGVPQIAIIGHSFGSTLALEYAARYPAQVSHLVLVSVPADFPAVCDARLATLIAVHPELRTSVIVRDSATGAPRNKCEEEFRLLPGAAHEAYNNLIMFPDSTRRIRQDSIDAASGLRNTGELGRAVMRTGLLTHRFTGAARLTMPVLIIAGGKDGAVSSAQQQALARSIHSARFVEYPQAGHFVYLDEQERFARDVISFMADK
jgi:proline iminopeptidase